MNSLEKIKSLSIWSKEIEIKPLEGGITNLNYLVNHGSEKLVVRLGSDIPEHLVYRSNEIIVSKAAYEIGVSPKLIHSEQGVLVLAIFWVFYVIKYYANFLKKNKSNHIGILENLLNKSAKLEKLSSPREIVFGHNDFLAANFLDDGSKIWVVDWEYGGFNDPLFDIGGLASNNDFNQDQEKETLEMYYEKPLNDDVFQRYNAMKTASLLRETMWSMVSELTSKIDFDYGEYTQENLNKFYQAYDSL